MSAPAPKETPCPDCGEMVRVNALRCWNCGGFMNPEMEIKYQAMQANPAPTIFSEVPAEEMHTMEDLSDDDFQLSMPGARTVRPAQDEIRLVPNEPDVETKKVAAPAAPVAEAPAAEAPAKRAAAEAPQVSHSVATGGDVLLDIARQEQRDLNKRLKGRRMMGGTRTPGGGLIIFCPYGCRVEVKEAHRGMTGKCPRCEAPFIVPVDPPRYKVKAEEAADTNESSDLGRVKAWVADLHLHVVDPQKLKIKADSLLRDFVDADVGMTADNLVVAVFSKKPGGTKPVAKGPDPKATARSEAQKHLSDGRPASAINAAEKFVFSADQASELRIVQPALNPAQNIFHGIPVFGAGRVAVQLPFPTDGGHPRYLSMGITQFWELRKALEAAYGITGFGSDVGLPTDHKYSVYKCHYMETPIKALNNVDLYKADTSVELEVAGYQCGACKATVSEIGRKKESLGGKSPKGIAKAKCPKCSAKMGENLLYSLKQDVAEPSMAGSAT